MSIGAAEAAATARTMEALSRTLEDIGNYATRDISVNVNIIL